jgi:hypothetical protein
MSNSNERRQKRRHALWRERQEHFIGKIPRLTCDGFQDVSLEIADSGSVRQVEREVASDEQPHFPPSAVVRAIHEVAQATLQRPSDVA